MNLKKILTTILLFFCAQMTVYAQITLEYWFDGDETIKFSNNFELTTELISFDALSSRLTNGIHRITYRIGSSNGIFTAPMTDWFEKGQHPDLPPDGEQYITEYRYWTDDNTETGKRVATHPAKGLNFNSNFFIPEEIPAGKHLFNMQFKDNFGQWSLVAKDSFNKEEMKTRVFVEPKLTKAKPVVGVENTQTLKGVDFTPGGKVNLIIKDSKGNIIPTDEALFEYTANGSFTYKMAITSSMPDGFYDVSAIDVSTGTSAPNIIFQIRNPSNVFTIPLTITAPSNIRDYFVNTPLRIAWTDFISTTRLIEKSGLVPKFYKVEYSLDGGANWTIIKDTSYRKAFSHTNGVFGFEFSPSIPGNYIVKVSDVDNVLNFNTSSFKVEATPIIKPSLVWDYSTPNRSNELLGVAADGTARVYIKLNSNVNITRRITKVQAALAPGKSGDNSSGTSLLGKIMYATDINKYSLEANEANSVTINQTFTTPVTDDVYFWYVAPDDFTRQRNNQDAERTVKASFTIHYDDNTSEAKDIDIIVVRPPLMLVHGLNGSVESFKNAHYNVDGIEKRFMYDSRGGSLLFKNSRVAVNLINYEGFSVNAGILLGITHNPSGKGVQNFQNFIKQMNEVGFAANRVDYVCHSMGGDIARTILSDEYKSYYRPSENSIYSYKNYDSGFINKLITVNTPHNGSPIADLVTDILNKRNAIDPTSVNELLTTGRNATTFLNGFFVRTGATDSRDIQFDVSPAVKDLRAGNNGVRFSTTKIKNHLIGANADDGKISILDKIGKIRATLGINSLYRLLEYATPSFSIVSTSHSLMTNPLGAISLIDDYMGTQYGYPKFLSNSDLIVPISSQFPSLDNSNIANINDLETSSRATIAYGVSYNHLSITDKVDVGTKIMKLLNSSINSDYFAETIASSYLNGNRGDGGYIQRQMSGKEYQPNRMDSIIRYFDKNKIKIISPTGGIALEVDSTVDFKIALLDTTNLLGIQFIFQGEYYTSNSKVTQQIFNVKIHSNSIGYNKLVVSALYDSSGFLIYHTDTASYLVKSLDSLSGFYVTPDSKYFNSNEAFQPMYHAVYNNYVGILNNNTNDINFTIADPNVIHYVDSLQQFVTKDTGSTYIVFTYQGFSDTAFVYITMPTEYPDMTFSGKVFLQGAYNTSTSKMNNTLNTSGILKSYALSQPYNSGSARYSGYEKIPAGYFDTHLDIVDWVLIELRDSTSPQTIVARRAAFVRQDGTLVEANMSGLDKIVFKDVAPGRYYVSIKHRNHLGIRSSSVIDFTESDGSYDFTTSAGQTFQNKSYTSTVQVGNVWAMRAGDANGNGNIKYNGPANDQSHILNSKLNGSLSNILNNLYSPEDINMDGKIRWNGPSNEQNYLLNTILHGSLTTIYVEQL